MIKPRCPDPERFALLIENRLGRLSRARILRHAADCVACRRHLAVASLPPIGPLRASFERHLASGRLTVCAGLILGVIVLGFLHSGESAEPAPRRRPPVVAVVSPTRPQAAPVPVEAPRPPPPERPAIDPGPARLVIEERVTMPDVPDAPPIVPDRIEVVRPRHESVAESPKPPPPSPAPGEPKVVEAEALGRLAILDPFGSLALEGSGARLPVQGSRVVPVEGRLTALGRPSGFRLGDGLRVQLAPGAAISVFQNTGRRCAGLSVLQGALLLESPQPQSIYLIRDAASGVLEGMNGPVSVSAGPKPDSLTVVPLGAASLVWKRTGGVPVELAAGEALGIDAVGAEVLPKGKARPPLARFVSWPEPSSLFYSSFEDGVQGMERPVVVQGASKEGYVAAAVAGGKGRKTIELALPASIQNLPTGAMLRLRVRTTASRIQCGVGRDGDRSVPVTVAQRNRSETAWTTLSVSVSALEQDGHRGRDGGRGRERLRGSLTLVAEAPSRVSAEELVFDIDEIEISRS